MALSLWGSESDRQVSVGYRTGQPRRRLGKILAVPDIKTQPAEDRTYKSSLVNGDEALTDEQRLTLVRIENIVDILKPNREMVHPIGCRNGRHGKDERLE